MDIASSQCVMSYRVGMSVWAWISSPACFFFSSRRRHTRCSRDWSSDGVLFRSRGLFATINQTLDGQIATEVARAFGAETEVVSYEEEEIGRASCRERV